VEGNIGLANAFNEMFKHAPLALEAQTERLVGPILAHQIKKMGEGVAAGLERLKDSAARNAKSVSAQGNSVLPDAKSVRDWAYEVNGVAMRVAQLEQRIGALSAMSALSRKP
jgi:ubiquinone biosynthesis protein UbiJ